MRGSRNPETSRGRSPSISGDGVDPAPTHGSRRRSSRRRRRSQLTSPCRSLNAPSASRRGSSPRVSPKIARTASTSEIPVSVESAPASARPERVLEPRAGLISRASSARTSAPARATPRSGGRARRARCAATAARAAARRARPAVGVSRFPELSSRNDSSREPEVVRQDEDQRRLPGVDQGEREIACAQPGLARGVGSRSSRDERRTLFSQGGTRRDARSVRARGAARPRRSAAR